MKDELISKFVELRVLVGYLGEKEQQNWWSSSFLSPSGKAFLSPVFPKTSALARVNGASGAAQVAHDDLIGIGDVYHLFRLPENIEYGISQYLAKDDGVLELIVSEDAARSVLQLLADSESTQGIGPLLLDLGSVDVTTIGRMASAYCKGFISGEQVYPYYRSKA